MQTHGSTKIARRIESAVRSVLPRAVDVRVLNESDSSVDLKIAGQNLRAQWLDAAWPSAIRRAPSARR
jgi:hypothetical protein